MKIELKPELQTKESSQTQGQQPELLVDTQALRIVRWRGTLSQPWATWLRVRAGNCALQFNVNGAFIANDVKSGKQSVCPVDSALFARGPIEIPIGFSRGKYEHYLVTWQWKHLLSLGRWVDFVTTVRDASDPFSFYVASTQSSPLLETKEKLLKICHGPEKAKEPLICGFLHEMIVHILDAKNEVALATISSSMPSFLKDLLKKVKNDPSSQWSLKNAADLVGYSPFHLSRTFKTYMGYGFPEFVDRCRVELAIKHLSEGRYSVDKVSAICGYSSTHGLREAMKEHIGFLPSEIRMLHQPVGAESF